MSLDYSSDEESLNDSTLTDVHLGFIDVEIEESGDVPTIEDTILGGSPVWLHPESLPDEKLITCDVCGNKMALYLQAFAPFEDKLYDRVIYIFGCKNTLQCSKKKGSVKAVRGIIRDPVKMQQLKQQQQQEIQKQLDEKLKLETKTKLREELTKNLFSSEDSSNPFGGNPFGANPFAKDTKKDEKKEEKKESLNTNTKPATPSYSSVAATNAPIADSKSASKSSYTLPAYPGYFVFVEKEKFKKISLEPELEKYKHLIDSNSIEEEEATGTSKAPALNAQASKISNMLEDTVFESFTNTLQHNSGQILRYNLGGKPLLYNGKDDVHAKFTKTPPAIPAPGYNPSSSRQFELQLMPKAILDLEKADDANLQDLLNGMSWGTIIVCTDVEDYVPEDYFDSNHVAYVEEYCGVQWEESV